MRKSFTQYNFFIKLVICNFFVLLGTLGKQSKYNSLHANNRMFHSLLALKPVVSNTIKPVMTAKLHTAARERHVYTARSNISALALTRDLLQTKGITGIYRGLGATLLR